MDLGGIKMKNKLHFILLCIIVVALIATISVVVAKNCNGCGDVDRPEGEEPWEDDNVDDGGWI